ncbi:hypothetical protein [Ramlibacter sp. Leaf400]|uniref:hypothetical protein n=1 Tax=Ramlibacter sp. Leaf400 TaxID=1736365 RepID=UPI0012E34181|nr:hypothetical protein [Ramlibacter sp. Leaf400]
MNLASAIRGGTCLLTRVIRLMSSAVLATAFLGGTAQAQTLLSETSWGGLGSDIPHGVAVATDGSSYMVGLSDSFTTDQFGGPRPAIFLVKFSPTGSVDWQTVWTGNTQRGGGRAPTVALTPDQASVYVTGLAEENGGDAVLLKFDSLGNLLWQKTWGGGATREESEAVATDAAGAAYISGTQRDNQAGTAGLFVVKFNADGTSPWQRIWNDASGSAVAVGADGHVYAAGSKMRTDGSFEFDVLALKLTSGGALVWDMLYAAGGTVDARGGMTVASDGGPIFAGAIQAGKKLVGINALVVKLSTDGALVFDRQWGGKNGTSGAAVALAPDGSIHVAGQASFQSGADEAIVFHVDAQGKGLDAVTWGGPGFESGHGVGVAGNGTVIFAAATTVAPPYALVDATKSVSAVRGAVTPAGGSLANAAGVVLDSVAPMMTPDGRTAYAGNFETVLVRFTR